MVKCPRRGGDFDLSVAGMGNAKKKKTCWCAPVTRIQAMLDVYLIYYFRMFQELHDSDPNTCLDRTGFGSWTGLPFVNRTLARKLV